MMTKREYLVGLGLAKPGRGRLSAAAHTALEAAIADGMTFDDDKPVDKPVDKSGDSLETPAITESNTPIPAIRSPKVRDIGESQLTGFTAEGWRVGFTSCRRCGLHANFCSCKDGLLVPSIVETLDEKSMEVLNSSYATVT